MKSPEHEHKQTSAETEHWNISREQLDKMSPSELAEAMEQALDDMTEETYDPEVIQAYLDALERKTPVPPHPGAEESYHALKQKIKSFNEDPFAEQQARKKRTVRLRSMLRVGLVAALLTACLFGAMVAAQAAGVDVFGAVARWTEEVFSFGNIPAQSGPGTTTTTLSSEQPDLQEPLSEKAAEIPEEAEEMQAILEEDGQVMYFPQIPDNFELSYSDLYIDPLTGEADLAIEYREGDIYISYRVVQCSGAPITLYEKDNTPIEQYEVNGIVHYVFGNNGDTTVAWSTDSLEYSIGTNANFFDIKALIQSMY